MIGRYIVFILFAFLVKAEVKSMNDGDLVALNSGVTKGPHDTVWWYFNDRLIGEIDGICCLYDGPDGRFKDRLKVDRTTGSLNITNITAAHAGRYEAKFKRYNPSDKTEKLNIIPKCISTRIISKDINPEETIKSISLTVSAFDSGKNKNEEQIVPEDKEKKISAVVGIVVGGLFLLLAAAVAVAVVKFTHCSIFDMKKNKQVLKQVSEDEPCLPAQNGEV